MVPVVGPFLLLGVLAWVAAIAMGVGSWFGMTSWRDRWAIAGALAGLGTFTLYLHSNGGFLPVLVSSAELAFPATAALFVGCGIAAAYGTLFVHGVPTRPRLEEGSPEETLWLHDAFDRLRVRRLDWLLAGALVLPGAGMLHVALNLVPGVELAVLGAASLVGPLFAGVGLLLRRRASDGYLAELDERESLPSETAQVSSASLPCASPRGPLRRG